MYTNLIPLNTVMKNLLKSHLNRILFEKHNKLRFFKPLIELFLIELMFFNLMHCILKNSILTLYRNKNYTSKNNHVYKTKKIYIGIVFV